VVEVSSALDKDVDVDIDTNIPYPAMDNHHQDQRDNNRKIQEQEQTLPGAGENAATIATDVSAATASTEQNVEEDEEEEYEYQDYANSLQQELQSQQNNPHAIVLMWLANRAHYAEENFYSEPYKFHEEDDDEEWALCEQHDEYKFQNGYYFANRYLALDSNGNDTATATTTPKLVAKQSIPEGTLLVSVPSNTFLYKRRTPVYKQLHPCDVVAKVLDAKTYSYPRDSDVNDEVTVEEVIKPSLERFVRPFIDSILALNLDIDSGKRNNSNGNNNYASNRVLWSAEQLAALSKILGNELEPKPNTLGLWAESRNNHNNTTTTTSSPLCEHPTATTKNNNNGRKMISGAYDYDDESSRETFRSTLKTVLTRGWDHRMVPIYHWIPRAAEASAENNNNDETNNATAATSSSANVRHSEVVMDDATNMIPHVLSKREKELEERGEPWRTPSKAYRLHSSRVIRKGETIVLPYHSVAQEFATTGTVSMTAVLGVNNDNDNDAISSTSTEISYRFWAQTLHDHDGNDSTFVHRPNDLDPYDDHLAWDYYPKTSRIEWVHKSWGVGRTDDEEEDDDDEEEDEDNSNKKASETLRATQRTVLQAQYTRLRSMEAELKALLLSDNTNANDNANKNAGNAAIYDYYELWMESLGVLLAHSRPARATDSTTTTAGISVVTVGTGTGTTSCMNVDSDSDNNDESSCSAHTTNSETSSSNSNSSNYDDLRERFQDPIDYNGAIASHECTNLFDQFTYETSKTAYAELEWTRSYIGGGTIEFSEQE